MEFHFLANSASIFRHELNYHCPPCSSSQSVIRLQQTAQSFNADNLSTIIDRMFRLWELLRAKRDLALDKALKQLSKYEVLIIDDIGQPLAAFDARAIIR